MSDAACRAVTMRCTSSRLRAVVATTCSRSATASPTVSNTLAFSSTTSAPEAARWARSLGQPSRGLTRRKVDRPQFSMARAAMPIFSPSCGLTMTITGPGSSVARPFDVRPMTSLYHMRSARGGVPKAEYPERLASRRPDEHDLATHEEEQRNEDHRRNRENPEIVQIGDHRRLPVELLAPDGHQLGGIVDRHRP